MLGIFVIAVMYQSNLIGKLAGQPLPGETDPARRVRGWSVEAKLVESAREKLASEGKPAFIIAGHYGITGLYSFYIPQARAALKSEPLVYSADSDEPANQFYFWPEYNYRDQRKGQNAIFAAEADLYKMESGWPFTWEQNTFLPKFDSQKLENGWLWKWLTQSVNQSHNTDTGHLAARASRRNLNPSPTSASRT